MNFLSKVKYALKVSLAGAFLGHGVLGCLSILSGIDFSGATTVTAMAVTGVSFAVYFFSIIK